MLPPKPPVGKLTLRCIRSHWRASAKSPRRAAITIKKHLASLRRAGCLGAFHTN